MHAMTMMIRNETRLLGRDLGSFLTVLLVPLAIVAVFGMIPTMREPAPDMGGLTILDALIVPIAVTIAIASMGLSILPTTLAGYRERGVLRRLSTTPVQPTVLLVAQLVVYVAVGLVAVALAVAVAMTAFGVSGPGHVGGFLMALVLGTTAMFTIGLLIAAVARTSAAATGLGMALFIPIMALGGVWFPIELLPDPVQTIGLLTPLGAMLQAVREAWAGTLPEWGLLVTLAVTSVVAGGLASWRFRWE